MENLIQTLPRLSNQPTWAGISNDRGREIAMKLFIIAA